MFQARLRPIVGQQKHLIGLTELLKLFFCNFIPRVLVRMTETGLKVVRLLDLRSRRRRLHKQNHE
jgi:hypothetical protein